MEVDKMQDVRNYSNISDIKKFWLEDIAPNYFDMENTNNYQVGVFGYINEIFGNTAEDVFNAINIARREFYPVTAVNKSTLYKMASMQRISLPMTTPSTAKAILLMEEKDIINNATLNNGIYTCVIDDSLSIMADDIPFLLDYPIVIISKKEGDKWIHTSHYDINTNNSLSNNNNRYIMNKVIMQNGIKYVLFAVTLRQLSLETISHLVVKDNIIDTVTMDFRFEGDLANFEVFYKDSVESENEIQLRKIMRGGPTPQVPFCFYELLDKNIIRLIFAKNVYFNPAFNSEIIMKVYTSLGDGGRFDVFKDSLTCVANSEKYPYNNKMLITGKINGKSSGGKDRSLDEEFRNDIIDAYATNNTITTSTDLQIHFDSVARLAGSSGEKTKILFRKKRDDALIRLFGAYLLLKDNSNNIVPTNTLDITVWKSQIVAGALTDATNRLFIKPGTLFEYKDEAKGSVYDVIKAEGMDISDNLDIYDDNSKFISTNPLLIAITLNPNIVGYYLNSVNATKSIEYKYVNDNTINQFIGSGLKVFRNAMIGENFYKIAMTISPASDIDPKVVIVENPSDVPENIIRAKRDGLVKYIRYEEDGVYATLLYDNDETEIIQVNNICKKEGTEFIYSTGYDIHMETFTKFVKGDVIATKKATDLGKMRIALDFEDVLFDAGLYVPFTIENYDSTLNSYDIAAYISTDDAITLEAQLLIDNGIMSANGIEDTHVAIPMNRLSAEIHVFYHNDDTNYVHKYSNYDYFRNYTLTNTYSLDTTADNYKIALVQQIDFIRSTINFIPNPEDPNDFGMIIKEVPVAKANWCKPKSNFNYLVDSISDNYARLYETYFLLENNFGIDLKFFNTYGKSRFFHVGIKSTRNILDSVNCSFSFGIQLTSLTPPESFLNKFRDYVKNYVESVNSVGSDGQSIYIMNLITSLKTEFSEIGYIEYYGLNNYDHEAQKIEGLSDRAIVESGIVDYIPEFINVRSVQDGERTIPKVDVLLLNS